jgi:hypothetical protein
MDDSRIPVKSFKAECRNDDMDTPSDADVQKRIR